MKDKFSIKQRLILLLVLALMMFIMLMIHKYKDIN